MLLTRAQKVGAVGTGLISISSMVHAHCPICALAVGAGAVAAQYYGMGIPAIGAFVGGTGVVMGVMVANRIPKEYMPHQKALIVGSSFILTALAMNALPPEPFMIPVLWGGDAGGLFNKVYWLDKAWVGIALGGFAALAANHVHGFIKKRAGRSLVPFQGVIATVLLIALTAGLLQWVIV